LKKIAFINSYPTTASSADKWRQVAIRLTAPREANNVSQRVFARYLNTSESTVEKWESGAKRPSPPLRKLLSVVQKHGLQVLA
jgi:putative transcriptional regulator